MRVKRQLLLDQRGRVFVAAAKMHHVEQNRCELETECGVVNGTQLRREKFESWAAASTTLQVFEETQSLAINIARADGVFKIGLFIDLQRRRRLGGEKSQRLGRRDLRQPGGHFSLLGRRHSKELDLKPPE